MTAPPEPRTVPSSAILKALMAHYRKPGAPRDGGVLIPEPEAPGSMRRCDLIRVSTMASRGGIDGHEIKVSRSDWLRELADEEKAEAWFRHCTRWHVVAPPGIVRPAELPAGWGLMELPRSGRRFKIVVRAAEKEPVLSVPLLAELLRRADNQRLAEIEESEQKHRAAMISQRQAMASERVVASLDHATRKRLEDLGELEKSLQVTLADFTYGLRGGGDPHVSATDLAAALADVRDRIDIADRRRQLDDYRDGLRREAARIVKQLESLR